MKKAFPSLILVLILLPLIFSSSCKGSIFVQPPEIYITMNDEFTNGNTSKKITIINNTQYNINTTWYLEHPNPISWMRPNRTYILNLSWVDVKPKWRIVPPNSTAEFYIHLNIPEKDELLDQHWETWITFKLDKSQFNGDTFTHERAIRVYIDTPKKETTTNNTPDYDPLYFILAATITTILLITIIFFHKKKK
jgi:hypothetical protein